MTSINFFIEAVFTVGSVINALLFLPQAIKLYRTKNSKELSFVTFAGFNIIQIFTILHGHLHSDKLLILGNILNFITCGTVTALILFYQLQSNKKT